jgi:gamma-glutamyltranspeptidase/glutathione hydrolase
VDAHDYSRRVTGSPLGWRELLADAIAYAQDGFLASDGQRIPPPRETDLFGPDAPAEIRRDLWPRYHPDALARGPLVQADLARTMAAVASDGPEVFYRGEIAKRIVAARRRQPARRRGFRRASLRVGHSR